MDNYKIGVQFDEGSEIKDFIVSCGDKVKQNKFAKIFALLFALSLLSGSFLYMGSIIF